MAIIKREFHPEEAQYRAGSFPQYQKILGTWFPVSVLSYDAAGSETGIWKFVASNYGSGDPTLTIYWYADSASSGNVVWEVYLGAITANTDTQDVETKTLSSANSATDSHLGTTGQRLHSVDVTLSNADSLAADDLVWLLITRNGGSASDTMANDAHFVAAVLAYSDT